MANNIGWGKGASNNSIGWGNVGTNGFGSIYSSSNSGETDLAGVISPSATFKQRVLDDSGIFEAQQCLDDLINQDLFVNSNFVLTPNGYKAGKLYALKPDSGDLDIIWQRNGNATRVNKDGLIESVGNDVPRLDYTNGDCPSLLVEEQSTNLQAYSESDLVNYVTFTNVQDSLISIQGFNNSFDFNINNERSTIYNRTFSPTIGVIYTFSFFIEMFDGSAPEVGLNTNEGTFIINFNNTFDNPFTITNINNTNIYRVFVIAENTSSNNLFGVVSFDNQNLKPFKVTGFQLEESTELSSYIPTNDTSVTRPADAPQPITPPIGTTEIVEVFEDGTTNTITTIPLTYTVPFGRFKYILFN